MKVLILGHGSWGKDEFASMLNTIYGLTYESSSEAASEIVIFPALKDKYGYKTPQECFEDRRNHREEWKRLITEYNTPDKARLCREILERSDCYVGMRCEDEFAASQHMFDMIFWVDAERRKPKDTTMWIRPRPGMIYINNNNEILDLWGEAVNAAKMMRQYMDEVPVH